MRRLAVLVSLTWLCSPVAMESILGQDSERVEFQRDVLPILREHCFRCHGPGKSRGKLSLTSRESVLKAGRSGLPIIVPGHPEKSRMIRRLTDPDAGDLMPKDGQPLPAQTVQILARWIQQGAPWPEDATAAVHWAYQPPRRPRLPKILNVKWPRNRIDFFVLSRLEKEGLSPSPPEEPARLLRRLYLTLIGLPPTPEEVDAFLADPSPKAYERIVDRLLHSPHYGERWAMHWLDLARYADSNGFQADQIRDNWAYRDWVIQAFNRDMPFDQFVIEQIAGDLLPNATLDQKIATGFHRMTPCNVEAGVHPEANRVNQIFDRVNTTATVFLGTTLECAQCHNHKYDPFTQEEYYRLFAFFNNTPLEVKLTSGVTWDFWGPVLALPLTEEQKAKKSELEERLRQLESLPAKQRQARKKQITAIRKQLAAIKPPTTLVMQELPKPRPTHVLIRGNYLNKGKRVECGTPNALHPFEPHWPKNRLGLAKWLASKKNPLLARVMVNRWWAEIFGRGIVATLEDFGSQGELPTHPELLDWLAVEFMEGGPRPWSVKHIHRLIVTSATFRQSSRLTPELLGKDPQNKLLARGPRFRLHAELIRDNALAVSGLLSHKMFGPPVMPYQPKGIWKAVGRNAPKWKTATDANRYRRGIYVVWRRSAPYPSFVNFDAPDRASCTVKRPRTNTPLQALTLLNDPAYAEMAVALAQRMIAETKSKEPLKIAERGFRLCLARRPTARERAILVRLYEQERQRLSADPKLAERRLSLLQPHLRNSDLEAMEVAAWFAVANALLNLDETICQ